MGENRLIRTNFDPLNMCCLHLIWKEAVQFNVVAKDGIMAQTSATGCSEASTSSEISLVSDEDIVLRMPFPSIVMDPESLACLNQMAGKLTLPPWKLNFTTWPTYEGTAQYISL